MRYPVDNLPPIHPGEFLRDDLEALGVSARKFAIHIHVPHNAVTEIMNGKRAITAQMAYRLARAFETTPQYWLNLQTIYELKKAQADMPQDAVRITPFVAAQGGTVSRIA
jgi:addiction module HigA family antidote